MDGDNFEPYKAPMDFEGVNKVYPSVREAAYNRNVDELFNLDRSIER